MCDVVSCLVITGSGLGWVVLHCHSPRVLEPRALQVCPSVLVQKGVNACLARGVGNCDLIKRTPLFALMGMTDAPKGAPFQTNKTNNMLSYGKTDMSGKNYPYLLFPKPFGEMTGTKKNLDS